MSKCNSAVDVLMARPRSQEHGFSIVEILVVMIIVLILMAIGFTSLMSARATGRSQGTITVANVYANAVEEFAREHDGRFPNNPGVAVSGVVDWGSSVAELKRGPKSDTLGNPKFYVRSVPESIQDGSIMIGSTGEARLAYLQTGSGGGYRITVYVKGRTNCAIIGGTATMPTGMRACSKR